MGISQTPQALVPAEFTSGGMTLLSSGSIGSSGLDLTSISSSYEQLRLKIVDIDLSNESAVWGRFNGDTGSNYYNVKLRAQNSTGGTDANSAVSYLQFNYETVDDVNTGAVIILDLPNYSDSTGFKVAKFTMNYIDNNLNNSSVFGEGFWKSESAIDRIVFGLNTGTVSSGTYELWGIK